MLKLIELRFRSTKYTAVVCLSYLNDFLVLSNVYSFKPEVQILFAIASCISFIFGNYGRQ